MRTLTLALLVAAPLACEPRIAIRRPMPAPAWALAERALLKANADAAAEFSARYVDSRGWLRCIERWGGNDGPDDAMENFHNWTLAYALGAPESLLRLYEAAWEGHLQQYTHARIPSIEMAREGMYHQEFVTSFDWEHNGEGLAAFEFYALARPGDQRYLQRALRFAGLYLDLPNYDPKLKIIRSLHNGSRGPKLTPATPEDWGGLPVAGHPERLTRYRDAANIRGDHPLNLCAATLGFNAYALTGERRYRDWLLDYAGAWRERAAANGGNIPSNIGLDGRIGGEWEGKWYGGVFGWNFDPSTASRNYYMRGPQIAFGEAFLLTADARFVDALRAQIHNLYAAKKVENGRTLLPNKYGPQGWYGYTPNQHFDVQRDIWLWSMQEQDRQRIASDPWVAYLSGGNANYPFEALQRDLEGVRSRVAGLRADPSTPDTRASDHPQRFSPVATEALVNLTMGANDPGKSGNIVHARVRYFDPERRRAGLSESVAALVEKIAPDAVTLVLVNTGPVNARSVVVQAGAYGEHEFESVNGAPARARWFTATLAPGCGERLQIRMRRYAHQPDARFPWER
ncbi:MAG: hypothetical protein ACE15B_21545 [Bryobacteraceae bacterium]